jgi:hypothetical protein
LPLKIVEISGHSSDNSGVQMSLAIAEPTMAEKVDGTSSKISKPLA